PDGDIFFIKITFEVFFHMLRKKGFFYNGLFFLPKNNRNNSEYSKRKFLLHPDDISEDGIRNGGFCCVSGYRGD
ncbi:hypothetical protein, partial [Blautia hydrogenotrophica]